MMQLESDRREDSHVDDCSYKQFKGTASETRLIIALPTQSVILR